MTTVAQFTKKYDTQLWSFSFDRGFGGEEFLFNLTNSSADFFSHRFNPINQEVKTKYWHLTEGDPIKVVGSVSAVRDESLIKDMDTGKKYLCESNVLDNRIPKILPDWTHLHQYFETENEVRRTRLLACARLFRPIREKQPDPSWILQYEQLDHFSELAELYDANAPVLFFETFRDKIFDVSRIKDPIQFLSSPTNLKKYYFKLRENQLNKIGFSNPVIDGSIPITLSDMKDGQRLMDKLPLFDLDIEKYNTLAERTFKDQENAIRKFSNDHPDIAREFNYERT